MKKNVSQRIIKSMMTFMMAAAFFASPTTILANDVAGNEDAKEVTEKVVDPGIDNFVDINCINGLSIDETGQIYVGMKNYDSRDVIDDYYAFEWTLGDKFVKDEDQSTIYGQREISVTGRELGTSTISVKITSKTDSSITKTISKEFNIWTTKAVFYGTTEKINVEEIITKMDSGKYNSYGFELDPAVNPIISKEIIAKAKEKDIDLDFTIYNGSVELGWYWLQAKDIENTNIDLNVSVSINVDTKEISDEFAKNYKPLIIEFGHNGPLPGEMAIHLRVNDWYTENFGTTWVPNFYLYHINEETQKLEPSGVVTTMQGDGGNSLGFSITHCSKYALTETELTEAALALNVKQVSETPVQVLDNQPNTGV